MILKAVKWVIIALLVWFAIAFGSDFLTTGFIEAYGFTNFFLGDDMGYAGALVLLALFVLAAYVATYAGSMFSWTYRLRPLAWILGLFTTAWMLLHLRTDAFGIAGTLIACLILAQGAAISRKALEVSTGPVEFLRHWWEFSADPPFAIGSSSGRRRRSKSTIHGSAELVSAKRFRKAAESHFKNDLLGSSIPVGAAYDRATFERPLWLQKLIPNEHVVANAPVIRFPLSLGHVKLLAGTGVGKTTGFFAPICLDYDGPLLINDMVNELYVLTARYRRELGHRVCQFTDDPTTTCTFDPCEDIKLMIARQSGDPTERARIWSKVLIKGDLLNVWIDNPMGAAKGGESGSEKFFSGNASGLILAIYCMLAAFKLCRVDDDAAKADIDQMLQDRLVGKEYGPDELDKRRALMMLRPDPDLLGVFKILSLGADMVQCWLDIPASKLIDDEEIGVYLGEIKTTFAGMASKTFNDVHSTARNSMSLLNHSFIKEAFAGSREKHGERFLSYEEVMAGKWTIFNAIMTKIPKVDLGVLRVIFFGIGSWLLDADPLPKKPVFLLDEAAMIGRSEWLVQQIAFCRKFFNLVIAYQDVGQEKAIWGDNQATLNNNCRLHLYSGVTDHDGSKAVSELVGSSTEDVVTVSHNRGSATQNVQHQKREELPIDEILRLDGRQLQVAIMPPLNPAIVGKLFYRNRPELAGRWDQPRFK